MINRFDQSTIPNPATGLLVFNTQNSGVSPDEVYANSYYYWNGTEWYHIPTTRIFEDISVPGVFVLNSNDTQTIGNINNGEHRAISFPNPQIINAGNIATLTNNETITILESGLYEVTAFVQYNPSQTADERRALLNTYIEKRDGGSGNWQLIAGGRTSWGRNTTHYLQTAQIPVTVVRLNAGDQIRFTIANKITSGTRSSHGNPSVVSTSVNNPVSKSLRLYLIGF
ncbi:hypothetical protein ACFOUP_11110 [Belliella kenyensis]|uniref:Uncharacterized protein n=1 Tax=Belliella kenyensis TaxID=1472724 RepID=A0ABV8EN02_9BACT|nr:hypothetical protein [Belliella kenyensis]MCH7403720.1 hypothetical protein [Belliella kenyensis]MDN3602491.1 hypothetical protein [Belliella kenyensis]